MKNFHYEEETEIDMEEVLFVSWKQTWNILWVFVGRKYYCMEESYDKAGAVQLFINTNGKFFLRLQYRCLFSHLDYH